MKLCTPLHSRRRAHGVTLIEVLVTMVIVAVGLLGLAGVQVRGLSIQKDAHGRALATQLATDMTDRMRSNTGALVGYRFDTAYGGTYVPAGLDCSSAPCSAGQQLQYDFDNWFARVRGGALPGSGALPGGWARITPEGATPAWNV
ncbi:MAG TPA: type IV pilus modification protein PilV, partial [Burkholderiaceae bacterium]|nr:type IV pilus modification protein PilV [Burkholderiaceae bacterium]